MKARRLIGAALAALLLLSPARADSPNVLRGDADHPAGCFETALGDILADAARSALGAQIAVVSGGCVPEELYESGLTAKELRAALPDDPALCRAELTPTQLRALLEYGYSHLRTDEEERIDRAASAFSDYPHLSGLTVTCDASTPAGARVVEMALDDGTALEIDDEQTHLTAAVPAGLLLARAGIEAEETEKTALSDALADYAAERGTLRAPAADCVTVIGTSEYAVLHAFPKAAVFGAIAFVLLCCGILTVKQKLCCQQIVLSCFAIAGAWRFFSMRSCTRLNRSSGMMAGTPPSITTS